MKKLFLFVIAFFFGPFSVFAIEAIPNATSGILIEANSGKILFEKEKDLRVSIASMTKMVAQIVIMEEIEKKNISLDDVVTVSQNASGMGGSQIYLETGEKISVKDLLKGISVASGNDATVAMAEYISGSEDAFVKRMNDVVKRLGLKNTHFVNCTGLDEDNHYSSSYDMAMIARELVVKHPMILEFSSIYEDYLRENSSRKFWLVNTNKLIRFYDGADGLKTGHTDDAGYCLAATAKRNNLRLIAIVLGESDSKVRNQETMELLDFGFNTVHSTCLLSKDKSIDQIFIDKVEKPISVFLKEDLCVIDQKDEKHQYDYKVDISKVKNPLKKNDVVGEILVLEHDNVILSSPLVVLEDVSPMKIGKYIRKQLLNFLYGVF